MSLPQHYSRREAARLLGISLTKLKEELAARRLGYRKLGGARTSRVIIPGPEIEKWLRRYSTFRPAVDDVGRGGRSSHAM